MVVGVEPTVLGGPEPANGRAVHRQVWTVSDGCHYDLPLPNEPSWVPWGDRRPFTRPQVYLYGLGQSGYHQVFRIHRALMLTRGPTTLVQSGPVTLEGPCAG